MKINIINHFAECLANFTLVTLKTLMNLQLY